MVPPVDQHVKKKAIYQQIDFIVLRNIKLIDDLLKYQ